MSDLSPNLSQEASGTPPHELSTAIQGVNNLGGASERLFSRLYRSINRRSDRAVIEAENRELKRASSQTHLELARLQGILATLDQGVIMQDMQGKLVLFNNAARDLLGSVKGFWDTELGTMFQDFHASASLEDEITMISDPVRVQINNRIVGARLAAVSDDAGARLGTIILLRDVTSDVVTERLKDQFVTAISHELRTPMAVIKGATDVILGQSENNGTPSSKMLETLNRNVDILDRMVIELLDISELGIDDQIMLHAAPVGLETLIWNSVNGLTPDLKRAKLDVGVMVRDSEHLVFEGDDQKLQWALGHILQNCIRYTEPGGHIVITAARADADHVAIQIVDTGVGISERDLPHIFDRFYRGEARTPAGKLIDPRGLGQGLYIALRVTEAHGGYLSVRSQAGQGSIFTVVLPMRAA